MNHGVRKFWILHLIDHLELLEHLELKPCYTVERQLGTSETSTHST